MSGSILANPLRRLCRATLAGVLTLGGVVVPLGCFGGPQTTPTPRPIADAPDDPTSAAFEAGAKRPPTVRTLYVMSKVHVAQGKDLEAELLLNRVIKETPKFVPAYCDLADVQMRRQRVDDAKRTLTAGLKVAPNNPVLSNDLGVCYLRTGEYEQALKAFQDASRAKPGEARYRTNAALATAMLGRYEDALALYKQVLPEADAHYNLGVICESIQDHNRASQEFQKAIALRNNKQRAAAAESKALGTLAANAYREGSTPPSSPPLSSSAMTASAGGD
jgi:Flp pilus assembly protein TadD